jgi:hypothetical protein
MLICLPGVGEWLTTTNGEILHTTHDPAQYQVCESVGGSEVQRSNSIL